MSELDKIESKLLYNFFKEYKEISPYLVLGLIILTFGLYILLWFYMNNKEFEKIDEYAPNSLRAIIILMVFPFIWLIIIQVIKLFSTNILVKILEIIGWIIILILILKYIYDFSKSFGKITQTNYLVWFYLNFIGIIGFIGIILGKSFFGIFFLFLVFGIIFMQNQLNSTFKKINLKKKHSIYR